MNNLIGATLKRHDKKTILLSIFFISAVAICGSLLFRAINYFEVKIVLAYGFEKVLYSGPNLQKARLIGPDHTAAQIQTETFALKVAEMSSNPDVATLAKVLFPRAYGGSGLLRTRASNDMLEINVSSPRAELALPLAKLIVKAIMEEDSQTIQPQINSIEIRRKKVSDEVKQLQDSVDFIIRNLLCHYCFEKSEQYGGSDSDILKIYLNRLSLQKDLYYQEGFLADQISLLKDTLPRVVAIQPIHHFINSELKASIFGALFGSLLVGLYFLALFRHQKTKTSALT